MPNNNIDLTRFKLPLVLQRYLPVQVMQGVILLTKKWRTQMNNKNKIVNRLSTLEDVGGVEVTISDEKKTIYVNFRTERSLDFKFVWSIDHFIGYFTDSKGNESQAVISIWSPIEAIHFVTAYSLLVELRAGRR
jgi:hypothetical protein